MENREEYYKRLEDIITSEGFGKTGFTMQGTNFKVPTNMVEYMNNVQSVISFMGWVVTVQGFFDDGVKRVWAGDLIKDWNLQIKVWAKLVKAGNVSDNDWKRYNDTIAADLPRTGFDIITDILKRIK